MGDASKSRERNSEILTFYYAIFRNRIRSGLAPVDAKKEAGDAVELRYGISRGRLYNIMSEVKGSHDVNFFSFRQNASTLAGELRAMNVELTEAIRRNEMLIALLDECADDS